MRILGLDIGEKRIGVAKADSETKIAVPVGFILADGSEWLEIAKMAKIQGAEYFILGLPRSNEGNETEQSLYVRNFAKTLVEKIPEAKVRFQDESLTSVLAEERLRMRGEPYEKGDIDAEAAAIILQDFLEGLTNGVSETGDDAAGAENGTAENDENDAAGENKLKSSVIAAKENINEIAENAKNLAKKESDKVKLNTKKAKHKLGKYISGGVLLVAILLIGTGVALKIKDIRAAERAAYYAAQEAAMAAEVFNFTILPGETIYEIQDNLIALGYSAEEVAVAFSADYDYDFLAERPAGATLEGYLFGNTHEFYQSDSVETILGKFLDEMASVISENNLRELYAARGLTLHEGIILASIVQKEASAAEMPTVAQVFLLRLDYGIKLGSDVTVTYALDTVDPERTTYNNNADALNVDSCYNTRLYYGLPCGPISNPGINALLAVANPSDTDYLYFLTGDDGVMYYNKTEEGHNQDIYDHCQELCGVSL